MPRMAENNLSVAGVTIAAATTTPSGTLPITGISGMLLLSGLAAVLVGGVLMILSHAGRPRRHSA